VKEATCSCNGVNFDKGVIPPRGGGDWLYSRSSHLYSHSTRRVSMEIFLEFYVPEATTVNFLDVDLHSNDLI
jgi:hypothetical protein